MSQQVKKSTRITYGDKYLKVLLVQCAWAATRTKNTYLRSKYDSLVIRRGKKRALIAVGHKILIAAYFILKNKVEYKELGAEYLQNIKKKEKHKKTLRTLKGARCRSRGEEIYCIKVDFYWRLKNTYLDMETPKMKLTSNAKHTGLLPRA